MSINRPSVALPPLPYGLRPAVAASLPKEVVYETR
jgi:hypothetical protein